MADDIELLRQYANAGNESAFAELVRRHVDLVYGAALRRLSGDAHAAADVTQQSFLALARGAPSLVRTGVVIPAWLYTTTRNTAVDFIRNEKRRRTREKEAEVMRPMAEPAHSGNWDEVKPLLDEAMDQLSARDREAIALRFFAHRPFAEIGASIGLSEDAARMRVERALEKLRVRLTRRGATAAMVSLLTKASATAAPAGLAATVASSVSSMAGVAVSGTAGVLGFMSAQLAPSVSVGAALIAMGIALHQTVALRRVRAIETVSAQENQRATLRVNELARRAESDEREVVNLEQVVEALRNSPGVSPPSRAATAIPANNAIDPLAKGKEFVVAHPEAGRLVEAAGVGAFLGMGGSLIRELGLPDEESRHIIVEAARLHGIVVAIFDLEFDTSPAGLARGPGMEKQVDQRLRELLSEERFQQLAELRRVDPARTLVKSVASAVVDTSAPLTEAQSRALLKILTDHSGAYREGRKVDPAAIDWPAVSQQAEGLLSKTQLAALNAAAHQAAIIRAMNPPRAGAAGGKK